MVVSSVVVVAIVVVVVVVVDDAVVEVEVEVVQVVEVVLVVVVDVVVVAVVEVEVEVEVDVEVKVEVEEEEGPAAVTTLSQCMYILLANTTSALVVGDCSHYKICKIKREGIRRKRAPFQKERITSEVSAFNTSSLKYTAMITLGINKVSSRIL